MKTLNLEREILEQYILNNKEVLEEVLNKKLQEYHELEKQKANLDFGKTITPEKLKEILPEIKKRVKKHLDIKDAPLFYYDYFDLKEGLKLGAKVGLAQFAFINVLTNHQEFNWTKLGLSALVGGGGMVYGLAAYTKEFLWATYNNSTQTMRIPQQKDTEVIGTLANLYTYHIQNSFMHFHKDLILSGYARGIQNIVCDNFSKEKNNPAYKFHNTTSTIQDLKNTYLCLCDKNKLSPNPSIAKLSKKKHPKSHPFEIGVTTIQIAAAKEGPQFYTKMVNNPYGFLRV